MKRKIKTTTVNIKARHIQLGYTIEATQDLAAYHMREDDRKYFEDKIKREEKALSLDIDNKIIDKIDRFTKINEENISKNIIEAANRIARNSRTVAGYVIAGPGFIKNCLEPIDKDNPTKFKWKT